MKHYNSAYLETTKEKLQALKLNSFKPFMEMENSVIADVGCGNGNDIKEFAIIGSSTNTYIGVDHDEKFIQIAKENNQANVDFFLSDVEELPFSNEFLDGIRNERLIQHLDNPQECYNEFYRVLKFNSTLLTLETDWRSISFYSGMREIEDKIINYLVYSKVKNGLAAQKVYDYLVNAKFEPPKIEINQYTIQSFEDACMVIMLDKILIEMMEVGLLLKNEHDSFLNKLLEMDNNKCFTVSICILTYTSTKLK